MHKWAVVALLLSAGEVGSQMPGTAVLQNAWAGPGFVTALNTGFGNGALVGLAGGWTPNSGHFQVSGGLGVQTTSGDSRGSYGLRIAVPFGAPTSAFGIAFVAGVGGATETRRNFTDTVVKVTTVNDPLVPGRTFTDTTWTPIQFEVTDVAGITQIPVGVALGWRRALGVGRGFSLFTTPTVSWIVAEGETDAVVRLALGGDYAFSPIIGATVGLEVGTTAATGAGGPSAVIFAVGLSYAFGRK